MFKTHKKVFICLLILLSLCTMGCNQQRPISFEKSSIISIIENPDLSEIEPISISASEIDMKAEIEYRLNEFADIQCIYDTPIEKGDIVSLTVSLYDENHTAIPDYSNMIVDCIVGDYEYDSYIEDHLIGKKSGDYLGTIDCSQTIYSSVAAVYCDISIDLVKRYIYPELTETFLFENFSVKTEEEFYSLIVEETKETMYRMELSDRQDKLIQVLEKNSQFDKEYEAKVDLRYEELLAGYEQYGSLFDMSLEEVLYTFELSYDEVKKNARQFQFEWELVLYYLDNGEIMVNDSELEDLKKEYALSLGYDTVHDYINDNGEQCLLEQVLGVIMKDYVYEKYVGEIENDECRN